jgi:hypothetical protein
MTQEHKDLLLKDLCARLPYGVKFACNKNIYTAKGLDLIVTDEGDWEYAVTAKGIAPIEIDFIKPYLFPMSSMTEEQKVEFDKMAELDMEYTITQIKNDSLIWTSGLNRYNWLIKNHFDVYDLIPMGLANDATGLSVYTNSNE